MDDSAVLLVDAEQASREATADALRTAGVDVLEGGTVESGTAALDGIACVVTEYDLPDGTAFDLLHEVRAQDPDIACIIFTEATAEAIESERAAGEIIEYLPKGVPNAREALVDLVEHSVDQRTQTAYPLPDDEADRLDALAQYVPAPASADAALDRLTRLAAALFDVPKVAIGLVDEREQRFLSCEGISLDPVAREDSVCTYAILDSGTTVIEDVHDDPRFEENEPLANTGIRFYASANLTTPEGAIIGTFCIYDDEPREFSETDREHLQLLADEAMEQLDLRRRLQERDSDD